jgi:hypothetical protein
MYSKNGSIPKAETDGTDGWIEVPDAPECPEGKEVIWWYPPGWVIRDPKPEGNWSWSQSQEQWVEIVQVTEQVQTITSESISSLDSSDISSLTSSQISGLNG